MAIILVVVHHAVFYTLESGIAPDWWHWVTEFLRTMRMPLFFAAAGLFAAKWRDMSWPQLLGKKVLLLVWAYTIWVFIRAIWFRFIPGAIPWESPGPVELALRVVVWPNPGWFLAALAIFFILLRATRSVPMPIQLGVAAVASIASLGGLAINNHLWDGIPSFYFFFLAGVLLRERILFTATQIPYWVRGLVVAGWVTAYAVLDMFDLTDAPVAGFALRIVGLAAGVALACSLTWAPGLQAVGRATLPIYVAHILVLIPFVYFFATTGVSHWPWMEAINPVWIGGVVVAVTYGFGRLAPRIGLGWLFATPLPLERWAVAVMEPKRSTRSDDDPAAARS